ncbi:unnamed protein product [Leuciscus chuanchicus]
MGCLWPRSGKQEWPTQVPSFHATCGPDPHSTSARCGPDLGRNNVAIKLTSGFKSQFNSNLVNGFLSRSKSQFNSNLVNGFLSRFKSQFKSKLVNGFLSRFKSQFKSKLVNSFLSRFNSKLVNGFLSRFKSRFKSLFKSKLVSSFLSRFNSKLVNGFLSRFKSQFNSKLVNGFLRQFNSKLVNSFLRQFNSKPVNSFLSQFNSKLVNSFLTDYEQIQCGPPGISGAECAAINCCFNGQQCYYGKAVTVQCIRDGQFVVVVARDVTLPRLSLDSVRLLGGSDPACSPVGSTPFFAIYQFPVTACGTSMMEDSGYVVYENRMTSSYEVGIGPLGSITRDSHFELLFQCRYSGTSVEALVVEVNTVPPPPPVAAPGPLRVELRLANGQCVTKGCAEGDEAYTSYYSDADYPVTKVLREPVYVEVHILERTDPNIVLMLGRCWATSTPSPLSLPQWDLLVDGCPYQDDRYLTTLVPVAGSSGLQFPTHYKRFVVKMFTFVDPASLAPLQETIFIHCSTAVCHPSSGSCEQSCTRKSECLLKLTSGFKSQFNSNLVNGFLSRSKSQFNSNLVNGFLSRFKSQFKSKLVNGFLSRFKSQFKSKLVNSFLSRFNSKLVNGFLSRFKSRFKSKLVSSFLSRFNSKLVNGFLSRFKSQFNSKLVNSFLSRFNSKLVNGFLRQFNSKLVNSFLSQFNSKLVNSFLSQFNSKLVNSFLSSFSLSSQWHRQIPLTNVL